MIDDYGTKKYQGKGIEDLAKAIVNKNPIKIKGEK